MPEPGDFILVHFVEAQALGTRFERTRMAWPLHVTLIPWFSASEMSVLQAALTQTANEVAPFTAQVGEEALLGLDHDVPVSMIADPEKFIVLHDRLVAAVLQSGARPGNRRPAHEQFLPHITHHGVARRYAGDLEEVRAFYLVRLDHPNTCEVVARFELHGDAA